MKYLYYLSYILRHKWYVAIECFRMGLIWRGLLHDLSKFLPSEFFPYADYFYGKQGCYKCEALEYCSTPRSYVVNGCNNYTNSDFDKAWLLHQHRNPHHWQFYLLREDDGGTKMIKVPTKYLLEMICDWVGAGKACGKVSPEGDRFYECKKWYHINQSKIIMNFKSKQQLESVLFKGLESYES